jgi:hypothetical protein
VERLKVLHMNMEGKWGLRNFWKDVREEKEQGMR